MPALRSLAGARRASPAGGEEGEGEEEEEARREPHAAAAQARIATSRDDRSLTDFNPPARKRARARRPSDRAAVSRGEPSRRRVREGQRKARPPSRSHKEKGVVGPVPLAPSP